MPPALSRKPAAGPASGLSFGDIVRILRQRIFLILFIWFVLIGATVGLTYYLQKYHQTYRAETIVKVESLTPRLPGQTEDRFIAVELLNRYVSDQAQLLKHPDVLSAAFKDPAITRGTQWYQQGQTDTVELFEELKEKFSVAPIPNTSYIVVSFAAANPEDAPKIVNTVVKWYLDKIKTQSTSGFARELETCSTQLENLRKELEQIRENKEKYVGTIIGTPGITSGLQVTGERWRDLSTMFTRLQAESLQYRAAYENMKGMDPSQAFLSPQYEISIQQDPQVYQLNISLAMLKTQLQAVRGRAGPKNRALQDLEMQVAAAEAQLDDIIRGKRAQLQEFQVTQAQTAFLNSLQASDMLGEKEAELREEQRDLDTKLARYTSMDDNQKMLEKQYEQMWNNVQQLKILATGQETIRVWQVGEATKPLRRHFPRWELFLPVGGFLGLLVGVGMAMLLELANTSIRTPRDIARQIHIPILGTVPDLDDEEVTIERIELASHTAPRSMIAEAFRAIRTNLLLSSPAERQRTVLITSAKAEEGRTSVAVNLAISIGQSGRRVLLVDANFHRPMLHTLFPKARRDGLSNILIGRGRLEDLASPTELPNLDVLTCGPIPPNPTELLTSRYMAELISQAADRYDQVIFDGPPVLLVSDALVLASSVDGVILVCRAKSASRGVVQRAREQLDRVNARIFGAVLNAAQVARGGYFREQMRNYYEYQPEEALVAAGTTKALPQDEETESKA